MDRLAEIAKRMSLLAAVEEVTGYRGVRSLLMESSLSTLQARADRWLGRLGGEGWGVRVNRTTTSKSGAEKEVISLEVSTPTRPEWASYWSCSAGQRRRFDVAVMLAVAELVREVSQSASSTLFFDEVMDALDEDGKRRACDVLVELAKTNCVVLITHDQQVVDRLRPEKHIHVENGRMQ